MIWAPSSKWATLVQHGLWTLQLSPLVRPEEGIGKSCRNVENENVEIDVIMKKEYDGKT
jgi:hypothetical protein